MGEGLRPKKIKLRHKEVKANLLRPFGLFGEYLCPKSLFKIYFYFYLFLAVLGLCCCALASSSCGERGLLFIALRGLLIAVVSLVVEHGLYVCGLQ